MPLYWILSSMSVIFLAAMMLHNCLRVLWVCDYAYVHPLNVSSRSETVRACMLVCFICAGMYLLYGMRRRKRKRKRKRKELMVRRVEEDKGRGRKQVFRKRNKVKVFFLLLICHTF